MESKIILFDGVCNLCNGLVNFIIDHDKKENFQICFTQSESAIQLLESSIFPLYGSGVAASLTYSGTKLSHFCQEAASVNWFA